jgi:hypothetical protein
MKKPPSVANYVNNVMPQIAWPPTPLPPDSEIMLIPREQVLYIVETRENNEDLVKRRRKWN